MNYTQNRELSWLRFDERVLEESMNENVPLFERLKFLEIFISNLDEFFMVRVGSLRNINEIDPISRDNKSNMTALEQLYAIYDRVRKLYIKKDECYKLLVNQINNEVIKFVTYKECNEDEKKYLKGIFKNDIVPFLSPQIIDFNHPFPHLLNKTSYIISILNHKNKTHYGLIQVSPCVDRYIKINDNKYISSEKLIYDLIDNIYKGFDCIAKNIISVTRNADISYDEEGYFDDNWNFRDIMKGLIKKRNRLQVVRLECHKELIKEFKTFLFPKLEISEKESFVTKTPFKLKNIYGLIEELNLNKKYLYPKLIHKPNQFINDNQIMNVINKRDVLLFYPYESMEPLIQLLRSASVDKSVTSIYITIYRLSQKSKLVDYLCNAAENGKDVNILIELRARFDEKNNIDFSERLEAAGCKVMYGFDEYKVHSKLCLITKKINNKIEYVTQVGTGNYNEKTVNIYTDYSLITSNQQIGEDALLFFKNMMIGNLEDEYKCLLVSPNGLKPKVSKMIDEQIAMKDKGYVFLKLNSITDIDIINKLSEASNAGVKIDLIIRGICCILPNTCDTKNIRVISIVGRFLEHSRIYLFGKENPKIYIASADMMTRNTQKRVEVGVPIFNETIKKEILNHITIMLSDSINARLLNENGIYEKIQGNNIDAMSIFQKIKKKETKPINTVRRDFLKTIEENNIVFERNKKYETAEIQFTADYKINNYLLKFINKNKLGANVIAKLFLINDYFNKNNLKLILIFVNESDELLSQMKRFSIESYNKLNIIQLINKLKM